MNPLHTHTLNKRNYQDSVEKDNRNEFDMELASVSSKKLATNQPNINPADDALIFDSVGLQFRPEIFWFQLFIHINLFFAPCSPNSLAQQFIGARGWPLFYNIVLPLILYLMIVSYVLSPSSAFQIMSGAVWIPLIYFIQHKLIVALKYASLSPSEYERFMQCKDPEILSIYQNQLQLIAAWLNRDDKVLQFELGAAAVRIGAKIADIYFILPDPKSSASAQGQLHYWHAFLRGRSLVDTSITETEGMQLRSDGKYQLSVYDLSMALIRRCDTMDFGQIIAFKLINFFNVVTFLIPFAVLAAFYNTHISFSFWVVIFYICSTIITFFFGNIVYNLLYVAIFDVLRQLHMINELTTLIRLSDLSLDPVSDKNFDNYHNNRFSIGRKNLEAILELNNPSSEGQLAAITNVRATTTKRSTFVSTTKSTNAIANSEKALGGDQIQKLQSSQSMSHHDIRYSEIGERRAQDQGVAELPRVSFDEISNIIAWTYARLVLQNFGDRFRFRIDVYVGGTISILLLLVIAALAMAFTLSDPLLAFESSFFLQSLVTIFMIFTFLLVIIYLSATINEKLNAHKQLLSRHLLRYQNKLQRMRATRQIKSERRAFLLSSGAVDTDENGNEDEENKVEAIIEQITAVSDVLQTETELKPFKVFGMEATSALTTTVVTTFISFLGILISLFTKNRSQVGQSLTAV